MFVCLGGALFIFALRIVDVSLGTLRSLLVVRGIRQWAPVVGFIEVTIWILAVRQVVSQSPDFVSVLAYSGGFAAGTFLGMWLENKIALGFVRVHVLSMKQGAETTQKIREAGFGATQINAEGQSGQVCMTTIVTPRSHANRLIQLLNKIDATSFITIENTHQVYRGYVKPGK